MIILKKNQNLTRVRYIHKYFLVSSRGFSIFLIMTNFFYKYSSSHIFHFHTHTIIPHSPLCFSAHHFFFISYIPLNLTKLDISIISGALNSPTKYQIEVMITYLSDLSYFQIMPSKYQVSPNT